MNYAVAPVFRDTLHAGAPWSSVAGLALLLMLGSGLADDARAQDVAAIPAASGEAMNSLLGRIAPATLAVTPPPRVTLERNHLRDGDRVRAGLDAYGRPQGEVGGVSYRWWVGHGAANFGVGVGALGYMVHSPEAMGAQTLNYTSSLLTVGWRYQVNPGSTVFADASGARRFNQDTADRVSTKVGVEWKARSNKFGLDGASRSLAFQLDSGYRMSLKVRRNGIGVYVRGQF